MPKLLVWIALTAAAIVGIADISAYWLGWSPTLSDLITDYDARHPWLRVAGAMVLAGFWWHLFGTNILRATK